MILHVDADAFFCQVERRRNPALAGCPALAVQQHQDVIAADAGAKKAGVTKRTPPADARALLRRVGGALVHVHTTTGQRVSYRPYLAASHELHSLLASADLAREVSRDGFNGVAVEKASIDEAYVQLPTGSDLRVDGARCADVIRDVVKARLGIVVSVGVAHNKLLAKLAGASAKPDGRRVIVSREDIADLLASTPAHELPGCGGALASKIRATLGVTATVADLARLPESALVSALGANPSAARLIHARSAGECDDPVRRGRGILNKSVGVHTSLTLTPRAMYGVPGCGVSASGGRPGMFEPLGCRETGRLDSLLRAMASDLAGRVMDLAHAEKRWPRTMTVSLILVLGRSENGDGKEVRCSKRGPFPDRDPRVSEADGETETGKAAHATAEALTRSLIANRGDALVAKVSITAGEFRASAGAGGGGGLASFLSAAGEGTAREPAPVDDAAVDDANVDEDAENVDGDEDEDEDEDGEWYPSPPFYFNPTAETSSSGGGGDRVEPPGMDDGVGDGGIAPGAATAREPVECVGPGADIASPLSPSPSVPPEQLDGSEPIDATNLLRCLAEGTVSGEDARRALRRRHERTGRAVPTSSASTP